MTRVKPALWCGQLILTVVGLVVLNRRSKTAAAVGGSGRVRVTFRMMSQYVVGAQGLLRMTNNEAQGEQLLEKGASDLRTNFERISFVAVVGEVLRVRRLLHPLAGREADRLRLVQRGALLRPARDRSRRLRRARALSR